MLLQVEEPFFFFFFKSNHHHKRNATYKTHKSKQIHNTKWT